MLFILYSKTNARTIAAKLGTPEYSYYFILKSYLPFLEQFGDIRIVYEPETEVDEIYRACQQEGRPCVFLNFTAPQNYIAGIECPTIHVVAWEYSTVPTETWNDDERNDWRVAFSQILGAITISAYSAEVIQDEMGPEFPVAAVPCAVWDGVSRFRGSPIIANPIKSASIEFDGVLIDSKILDLSINLPTDEELAKHKDRGDAQMYLMREKVERINRDDEALNRKIAAEHERITAEWRHLNGMYANMRTELETPIAYAKEETRREVQRELEESAAAQHQSRLAKRKSLKGRLLLLTDFALAIRKELSFHLRKNPRAPEAPQILMNQNDVDGSISADQKILQKSYDAEVNQAEREEKDANSALPALQDVDMEAFDTLDMEEPVETDSASNQRVDLDGVVYTALINPFDGRKNWVDMVVAFCWAFKDVEDATLVLKVSASHIVQFADEFVFYLRRLAPMKCRIVVIYAYLDGDAYDTLFLSTSFYVNTSYGEGQSIPLCEAMSSGIPAIAPKHTAMRDYVDNDAAIVFDTRPQLTHWQHDPRRALRCMHFKPDWMSLVEAYRESYDIAKNDPER
ncbi:MAG: glycosyltransferase, partial [Pseudomonadota bacterium]